MCITFIRWKIIHRGLFNIIKVNNKIINLLYNISFIVKSFRGILPAVVINKNTEAIMNRCEIKGTSSKNSDAKTIGLLIKMGDSILKECKIHN